jgi:hypothetical protein
MQPETVMMQTFHCNGQCIQNSGRFYQTMSKCDMNCDRLQMKHCILIVGLKSGSKLIDLNVQQQSSD